MGVNRFWTSRHYQSDTPWEIVPGFEARNFLRGRRLRFRAHHAEKAPVAITNRTLLFGIMGDPRGTSRS